MGTNFIYDVEAHFRDIKADFIAERSSIKKFISEAKDMGIDNFEILKAIKEMKEWQEHILASTTYQD